MALLPGPVRRGIPALTSGVGVDVFEQAFHGIADLNHGGVEGGLICARRLAKSAHLSHELQGRRRDFLTGRGLFRPAEYFDAAAHTCHHYMKAQDGLRRGWFRDLRMCTPHPLR